MFNLFSWIYPKIGTPYRYDGDHGGKFSDGTCHPPLKYIPTEIQNNIVYYDVITSDGKLLRGDALTIFSFWLCFVKYK